MLSNFQNWSQKRQFALCIALGLFASLSYAPINAFFSAFIAFPIWLNLLENQQTAPWKKHLFMGWCFGLGYFTGGLYWITFSLGTDLSIFWWLIPFSLLGMPAILAFYIGAVAILMRSITCTGISRCLWFAILWTTAEVAWGSGSLGLPWNPLGSMWSFFSPILQTVSVFGIYGLTLLTAVWVSLPILFKGEKLRIPAIIFGSSFILLFLGASLWGYQRPLHTPLLTSENLPIVRLVQPSVPQDLDWSPEKAREQFYNLMNLSQIPADEIPDITIWPESALPILLDENKGAREEIAKILKPGGYLVSGSLRRDFSQSEKPNVYNSLIAVDENAQVIASYDKFHLVPFGEYVPMRSIIPAWITKITSGDTDFSRGTGLQTLAFESFPPFSPLICYEVIFSGQVIASSSPRAQWILVITNDAWYGNTSGPYQHLQLTRLRSIEEGVPLVRAANSGVSAVFDAFGRELVRKELGERGILDVRLPAALMEPTLFSLYGHKIFIMLMALWIVLAIAFRRPTVL